MVPHISIIIPFYNSHSTLTRAIESVFSQSINDWELILVNDGSTDNSESLIRNFIADPRIVYIYQKNSGVSAARNLGVTISRGIWLVFLDSDDALKSDILKEIKVIINGKSYIEYIVFGINYINRNINIEVLPKKDKYFARIPGTFVIKKSLFLEVGGYDERLKFGENTELFHRVELKNSPMINCGIVSLNYFNNLDGGSKNLQNMIDSNLIILEKHNDTLSTHSKRLYHQVIGVNQLRFRRFSEARFHLWRAFSYNPWKFKTLARFAISLWPWLAKKFYSKKVKFQ